MPSVRVTTTRDRNTVEPDAFVLGVTEPTEANSGCRITKGSLFVHNGNVTTTHPVTGVALAPGDVVSGVLVKGRIVPSSGIYGVTFRDCWVDGSDLNYVTPGTDYWRLIDQRSTGDVGRNHYEYVTVDPITSSYLNVGFQGGNFRAYRCFVRNVTDAFSPHGTSSIWKVADIEGCFADDFYIDTDPNQTSDFITHNDFLQCAGKIKRLSVVGNAVGATGRPRTSNFLLQTGQGTYIDEGVTIDRNWFRGHATLGSTMNAPVDLACDFVVTDNIIHSSGNTPRNLIHASLRSSGTITGNVDENGSASTITNA